MNGDFQHPYFPAFLDLDGRLAVVVGGGASAEWHVHTLLRYSADVLLVAPAVTRGLDELVAQGVVDHEQRDYIRGDLAGAFVVICAVASDETCRAVYREAEGNGCLISTVGRPELSSFVLPAVVERGLMQVAVSTAGASPEVARDLKAELELQFGPEWEPYTELLGKVRYLAYERISDDERRDELLERLAVTELLESVRAGTVPSAEEVFRGLLFGDTVGDDATFDDADVWDDELDTDPDPVATGS